MDWSKLIGKKIVAFRGLKQQRRGYNVKTAPLSFILFDDNKTIIELNEQDAYDYHDCASSARLIDLREDANLWNRLFNKEDGFDEPDNLTSPF